MKLTDAFYGSTLSEMVIQVDPLDGLALLMVRRRAMRECSSLAFETGKSLLVVFAQELDRIPRKVRSLPEPRTARRLAYRAAKDIEAAVQAHRLG